MWEILRCHYFNPKLPTFIIASSFTAYLIYVLYGPKNGIIKQIEVIKLVLRLILKRGIKKSQYFDPKLSMFAVVNNCTAYLICVLYKNCRIKQIGGQNQIDIIIICHYETFLFLQKSVTSVF